MLSGRQKVRARKLEAKKKREAIASFVARTGAPLVDDDEYLNQILVENQMRARAVAVNALKDGAKPWR